MKCMTLFSLSWECPVERDGDCPVALSSVRVSASFVLQRDGRRKEGMSAGSKDDICDEDGERNKTGFTPTKVPSVNKYICTL